MTISKAPWTTTHGWIYDVDEELVGICWGKTPEEAERKAQLASTAPDMLDALETIMDIGDKACRDIARAAIKKARGEE